VLLVFLAMHTEWCSTPVRAVALCVFVAFRARRRAAAKRRDSTSVRNSSSRYTRSTRAEEATSAGPHGNNQSARPLSRRHS